jgi:hypothetical protein
LPSAYRENDQIVLDSSDENFLFPKNETILLSNVKKLAPFLLLTCFPKEALTILNEKDIFKDSTNVQSIDNKKILIIKLLKDAMKEKKINSYLDAKIEFFEKDLWDEAFSKIPILPEYTYLRQVVHTALNLEEYENSSIRATKYIIDNIKFGREVYTFLTEKPILKKKRMVKYNSVFKMALFISVAMLVVKRKSIGNFFYSDIPNYLLERILTK